MNKHIRTALTTSLLAAAGLTLLAPFSAHAREGASSSSSIGHGIKCRWVTITQADGTVVRQQICTKGV